MSVCFVSTFSKFHEWWKRRTWGKRGENRTYMRRKQDWCFLCCGYGYHFEIPCHCKVLVCFADEVMETYCFQVCK